MITVSSEISRDSEKLKTTAIYEKIGKWVKVWIIYQWRKKWRKKEKVSKHAKKWNVKPEEVARIVAEQLLTNLAEDGRVDKYLQDQFIIFKAWAKGKSLIRIGKMTLHKP